jgi:HEAT repeat protein
MYLEELLISLKSAEDEVERAKAAEDLGSYNGEEVIWALIEAMDDDELVSVAAMESLKKGCPDSAPFLRQALEDPRLLIRRGAAGVLASFPSRDTEAALRRALKDQSPHVRGDAARSLGEMIKEDATAVALRGLLEDPESFPRYQALRTLRALDPEFVDEAQVIRRDLESDDTLTRVAAIHFIREEGKREWLPAIEELLSHPDLRIRRAANWAWEQLDQERT